MKAAIFIIFLFLSVKSAMAQKDEFERFMIEIENSKHPIDVELMNCSGEDLGPRTIVTICASEAQDQWDKELNKYYNLLMKNIKNPEYKKQLKEAQLSWILFRDKEFENIANMIDSPVDGGSMYPAMRNLQTMKIVRNRALELKMLYEDYTMIK